MRTEHTLAKENISFHLSNNLLFQTQPTIQKYNSLKRAKEQVMNAHTTPKDQPVVANAKMTYSLLTDQKLKGRNEQSIEKCQLEIH